MPSDVEVRNLTMLAERNLLGAILLGTVCFGDNELIEDVKSLVAPSDFFGYPVHDDYSRYYAAMIACEHPDVVTVTAKLYEQGKLETRDLDNLRDLLYLHYDCSSYNYMEYARIVKEFVK